MMDAQVFGCKVSDGLPAIVTTPGRSVCRYCRWLPRVRASSQPAASMRLMASRTLTATPRPYADATDHSGGGRAWSSARGAASAGSPLEAVRRRGPDRTELALYLDSTHAPLAVWASASRSARSACRSPRRNAQIHCAPGLRCRCSWRAVTRLPYAADAQLMSDSGTLAHVGPPRPSVSRTVATGRPSIRTASATTAGGTRSRRSLAAESALPRRQSRRASPSDRLADRPRPVR